MLNHDLPLRYRIPFDVAEDEFVVKKSLFVGTAGRAHNVRQALGFVERVRSAYPDANHHAYAYRIAPDPGGEMGSSDDGEPGGTAGRPMLAVLDGSGLRQVVVVGTRFFGGIKLGTGGLVRAYSQAARLALASLPTEWRVLHYVVDVVIDYALYGSLQYIIAQCGGRIEDEGYTDRVRLTLVIPATEFEHVSAQLADLSSGKIVLDIKGAEKRYETGPQESAGDRAV